MLNNRGNSLIGVMIAAGAGIVILTATATSMVNQGKSVSFLEDRLSRISFDRSLKNGFMSPSTCGNTLVGSTIPAIGGNQPITVLRDRSNNVIVDLSSSNPLLKSFEKLNISQVNLLNIDTPSAPGSSGNMKLEVNLARQRSGGGVDSVAPVELDLFVTTDAVTGAIASCSFLGGVSGVLDDKACIMSGLRRTSNSSYRDNRSISSGPGDYDQVSNYTPFTEIYINGEKNIKTQALVRGTNYCWGYMYGVYEETYDCENKKIVRRSRRFLGSARGEYNDANCGP